MFVLSSNIIMSRMVYNFILNSVSLPIFYAVSVFQREMEIPALPLETVVEFFTNGTYCACCMGSGRNTHPEKQCTMKDACHTKKIKDMLVRLMDKRAFLPKDSCMSMTFDGNCMPYITAYGNAEDRCDMSSHALYARVRPLSVMRGKSSKGSRTSNYDQPPAEESAEQDTSTNSSSSNEAAITEQACKMFAKQCFQHYSKPFCDCAMITEGEFSNSMDEFSKMTTKFAQFFGDMPFFGKHSTVMHNLGIHNVPRSFQDLTNKQVFEQGQPIIRAR